MHDFSSFYSRNANSMRKSVIRELLKLTNAPGIISFAGGLPDPQTFPVLELKEATNRVFDAHPEYALQYGTTEGEPSLRKALLLHESEGGIHIGQENLLVTSASQQGLDLIPKVFIDPGDAVITGRPTYLGAIQAVQSYQGRVVDVPFAPERDGFDMAELEKRHAEATRTGLRIKYIYVIPDFQNPTGITWSRAKREALLRFAYERGLPVVEDSPYRHIRFRGEQVPTIFQLDRDGENRGNVILLKTFSKILAPGMRIGWVIGREEVISKLVVAKQAMDLCSSNLTQMMIAEYMASGALPGRIARTAELYGAKRDFMLAMLERHMPQVPGLSWTKPEGGLFLWITLPAALDTDNLFGRAIEKKVAYVAGSAFYANSPEKNSMRINFSYSSFELIEEGIKRLASVIEEEIVAKH